MSTATTPSKLDQVLDLSTTTAKGEHGGAPSKKVTATATLNVSSTTGTKTVNDGAEASVTLGTSHSETDTAAPAGKSTK